MLKNLHSLGIDYLVAIGGDGTLSYAARLRELGIPVIAIPKTMDNDVQNTEYCIGFSTAITRAMDAINRLPQTGEKGLHLKRQLKAKLIEHRQYINKHGQDLPEIRNWKWDPTLSPAAL